MRTRNPKPYTFGSLYKEFVRGGGVPLSAGSFLQFDSAGPFQNTYPSLSNSRIRILNSGVYQITANLLGRFTAGQSAIFNLNRSADGSEPLGGSFFEANGFGINTSVTVQSFLYGGEEIGIYIHEVQKAGGHPPHYQNAGLTIYLFEP